MKKVTFGAVGFICGAIVAIIIGFGWGGWTLASSAKKMTDEAALASASQAAICVSEFMKDPNHEEKFKEFEGVDIWKRAEFVQNGGWIKIPEGEKVASHVAEGCAKGLEALIKK